MPGYPVPFIKFREDTNNGFPLAGGKLYSFAAGTSTPLATYTTQALNILNANPTILDASGRANVFIEDGVGYKFVLHDPLGNEVWTVDGVEVPPVAAPVPPVVVPAGVIVAFGGTDLTVPAGWLLCDGRSVLIETYPALHAAILTAYGTTGSPNFNLPDLRQRFPLGKAVSGVGVSLGDTGGLIDHTHSVPCASWHASSALASGYSGHLMASAGGSATIDVVTADDNNSGPANPPFLVVNFIIKT